MSCTMGTWWSCGPRGARSAGRVLALPVILLLALAACQSAGPTPSPARSMKGWEIYSWQEAGAWRYALLVGTNRIKSFEEVQAAGVDSLSALEAELEALAPGEQLFWSAGRIPHTAFPPDETVERLRNRCQELDLALSILTE